MAEHQKPLCDKCGSPEFAYDSLWKEYSCKNCGWIVDDDEKISAIKKIDKTKGEGLGKDFNKEAPRLTQAQVGDKQTPTATHSPGTQESEGRMLFGSNSEEKQVRVETVQNSPTSEELSQHLASCSSTAAPSRFSAGQFPQLLKHVGLGLLLSAVGVIVFFVIWPKYAHSQAIIPSATIVFFLGGIAMMIAGPCYIGYRVWDFIKGVNLGTPEEAVKSFIASINDANYGRAWNCLTPLAQQFLKSPKDFKHYQKRINSYLEENVPALLETRPNVDSSISDSYSITISRSFKVLDIELSQPSENTFVAKFDLAVEQQRSLSKRTTNKFVGIIKDGKVVFPQMKSVVQCGDSWYLATGTVDLPADKEK